MKIKTLIAAFAAAAISATTLAPAMVEAAPLKSAPAPKVCKAPKKIVDVVTTNAKTKVKTTKHVCKLVKKKPVKTCAKGTALKGKTCVKKPTPKPPVKCLKGYTLNPTTKKCVLAKPAPKKP